MIFAAAPLFILTGCGTKEAAEEYVAMVKLYTVSSPAGSGSLEFPGRVKSTNEVNMAFKVSGTLQRVCVNEGDRVTKGQLIAEIDPRDYQVQFDAIEAEYNKVKAEAERIISLYNQNVTSADNYDKARYGLQQITAKYENAKNQLSYTKIYAPFSGYVQKRLYDPPTVISAGMPVVELVAESHPEIEINIPSSTYMERSRITGYSAVFDFLPDREVSVTPVGIAPKANANQLYTVRLSIPTNLTPQPAPGMNVMVKVQMSDTTAEGVQVPTSAVFKDGDKACVWVYNPESKTVSKREVSVKSIHTDGMSLITFGLSTGEIVVRSGVHYLRDNQQVEPLAEASDTNVGGLL